MMDIQKAVAERLAKSGEDVFNRVVSSLAGVELDKRVAQITAAYAEWDRLVRDYRRINRPDNVSFNADRSIASETFSKARLDEIKKIEDRIARVEDAINTAFAEGNYDKLNKLGDGKAKGGGEQGSADSTG